MEEDILFWKEKGGNIAMSSNDLFNNYSSSVVDGNCVYVIKNIENGLYKIGLTGSIKKRYKQINSSFKHCGLNPNLKIERIYQYKDMWYLENAFHRRFCNNRIQNEWFSINEVKELDSFWLWIYSCDFIRESFLKCSMNIVPLWESTYNRMIEILDMVGCGEKRFNLIVDYFIKTGFISNIYTNEIGTRYIKINKSVDCRY